MDAARVRAATPSRPALLSCASQVPATAARPASSGRRSAVGTTRTSSPTAQPSSCSGGSECMSFSPGGAGIGVGASSGSKRPRPQAAGFAPYEGCSPRRRAPTSPTTAAPRGTFADPWAIAGSPWAAVVGCSAAKAALQEALLLPQLFPPGVLVGVRRAPCALLLHGPPGTGKTQLVRAAADASGRTLICGSAGTLVSKWAGESEAALRALFHAAAAASPAILFLDEIDALAGPSRGDVAGDAATRRLLVELLLLLGDAAVAAPRMLVCAATNRACDLDPALIRRFERRVAVPLPCAADRLTMLSAWLDGVDVDLDAPDDAGSGAAPLGETDGSGAPHFDGGSGFGWRGGGFSCDGDGGGADPGTSAAPTAGGPWHPPPPHAPSSPAAWHFSPQLTPLLQFSPDELGAQPGDGAPFMSDAGAYEGGVGSCGAFDDGGHINSCVRGGFAEAEGAGGSPAGSEAALGVQMAPGDRGSGSGTGEGGGGGGAGGAGGAWAWLLCETEGWSGGDLRLLAADAAMAPVWEAVPRLLAAAAGAAAAAAAATAAPAAAAAGAAAHADTPMAPSQPPQAALTEAGEAGAAAGSGPASPCPPRPQPAPPVCEEEEEEEELQTPPQPPLLRAVSSADFRAALQRVRPAGSFARTAGS